jgi:hypothetical protein
MATNTWEEGGESGFVGVECGGWGEGAESKSGHSNPYSTAIRHASLAFLLGEACCLRERGEEKSSSQAGHECALGVERVDLRGVWDGV